MDSTHAGHGSFLSWAQRVAEQKLFGNSNETVILIIDQDSNIIYTNSAYKNVIGLPPEVIVGRKLSNIEPKARGVQTLKSGHTSMGGALLESVHKLLVKGSVIPVWKQDKLEGAISIFSPLSRSGSFISRQKEIVGSSRAFNKMMEVVFKVSLSNTTVLITGESGVGKELIAEYIHNTSPWRTGPFVGINCAAIPEQLLESELFGYEPGAFTGASKSGKLGKIQLADKGTLFLDEISEMSPLMQAKLLRVLQEREIEKVGGTVPIPVDFRLVSATNKNLLEMVKNGTFREDLYYRLNIVPVDVPPLRERKSDIPQLCRHFIKDIMGFDNKKEISDDTMEILLNYDWPGNIRQLKNIIEYASVMANDIIFPPDLPALPKGSVEDVRMNTISIAPGATLEELNRLVESKAILLALEATNYNKTEASKMLGISRQALYLKAQDHGISLKFN